MGYRASGSALKMRLLAIVNETVTIASKMVSVLLPVLTRRKAVRVAPTIWAEPSAIRSFALLSPVTREP